MSEMVERIARAIYEGRNGHGCKPWSLLTQMHKGPYFQDAKDAIRAMREPTKEMREACHGEPVSQHWALMTDAALK